MAKADQCFTVYPRHKLLAILLSQLLFFLIKKIIFSFLVLGMEPRASCTAEPVLYHLATPAAPWILLRSSVSCAPQSSEKP